jgi:hypothetical protein
MLVVDDAKSDRIAKIVVLRLTALCRHAKHAMARYSPMVDRLGDIETRLLSRGPSSEVEPIDFAIPSNVRSTGSVFRGWAAELEWPTVYVSDLDLRVRSGFSQFGRR